MIHTYSALKSTKINSGILSTRIPRQDYELQELAELAEKFRIAHTRLNDIELRLHDTLESDDRFSLLMTLEQARMDYSDARFALSTRNTISTR